MINKILSFFGKNDEQPVQNKQNIGKRQQQRQKVNQNKQHIRLVQHKQNSMIRQNKVIHQSKGQKSVFQQVSELGFQLRDMRDDKSWHIFGTQQKEETSKWQIVMRECKKVKVNFIFATDLSSPLQKISHIEFNKLTNLILSLNLNQRSSVQDIKYLGFELVKCAISSKLVSGYDNKVNQDHNNIISIKPLNKTKFSLSVLSLTDNHFKTPNLSRVHMRENKISSILNLGMNNVYFLESGYINLFKIEINEMNLINKNFNQLEEDYFKHDKYQLKLYQKFDTLGFEMVGVWKVSELIESKFEYLYWKKRQKRKDKKFLIQLAGVSY